jgi:hypothetical protein
LEVKNASLDIASTQKTLLVLFDEIMQEFHSRIGIDRKQSSESNENATASLTTVFCIL